MAVLLLKIVYFFGLMKPKGVTTQVKVLEDYNLMVLFVSLTRVHMFFLSLDKGRY